MRKQKGFSLIELLIVVAIILIIAAIAIPNLMRSKMSANESGGAATVRTLITDSILYANTYPTSGYPTDLSFLGSGGKSPCVASATTACMADAVLACGPGPCAKDNYQYTLTGIAGAAGAGNTDFVAFGTPTGPSQGNKDFCATSDGVVRYQASPAAPPTAAITTVALCGTVANVLGN